MRVAGMVRRICSERDGRIHAGRLEALGAVVEGLISSEKLSVTGIGRGLVTRARPKHSIKRVDRLLSNPHLQSERWAIFGSVARRLVGDVGRPVVLMDWTTVVDGFSALVAAVPVGGRALTIYEEVHPERSNNKPRVQARFLRRLGGMLPIGCQPIIVVDAGFKGPFFSAVRRMGWDFIGRERQHIGLKQANGDWIFTEDAFRKARTTAKDLGWCVLNKTQGKSFEARLVAVSSPRKPNHPWKKRFRGGGKEREGYKRNAHQPWLLPTSLTDLSAAHIVALYAKRMQIEQIFRDLKNPRFGWCLRHARGYSAARLTILLLIAALAALVVMLVGLAVEQRGYHRAYQANTVRSRVLSLFVLGAKFLRRFDPLPIGDALDGAALFRATLARHLDPIPS
jgi:hypothetical protein